MGAIRVVEAGALTTVQDARGRPGLGRFGIPRGGAMDRGAASLANRLVGNGPDAALLEVTLRGPVLELEARAHIAFAGADLRAEAAYARLVPGHSHRLAAGTVVRFGDGPPAGGTRSYLGVEGGFRVRPVLGSVSTDVRSRFGGPDGRPLAAGDRLEYPDAQDGPLRSAVHGGIRAGRPVRVIPTPPGLGWFTPDDLDVLAGTAWTVSTDSDRTGMRLTGGHVRPPTARTSSLGVPVGAIQVPPSGEPIVTMPDGPVTGGYPVIAIVATPDLSALAQAAPGSTVRFALATIEAVRARPAEPAEVEIDPGDLGAGWAR